MGNEQIDFLIIGQGLAGTCLAYSLIKKGKKVCVADFDGGARCSRIAAGTINPVSFKTFGLVWKAEILVPFLQSFYKELGEFLDADILINRSILKVFKNGDQRNLWKAKVEDEASKIFMDSQLGSEIQGIHSRFGFGRVKNAGNLDLPLLLKKFREYLLSQNRFFQDKILLEDRDLSNLSEVFNYHGLNIAKVIFCTGHDASFSPTFSKLPFRVTKGEVLIIESKELAEHDIVHDGINVIPLGNHRFWVGSTFDWDDMSIEKTIAARNKMQSSLESMLKFDFKVVEQKVGIRPTVRDRRPIIGMLEENRNVGVFNGLGSRGVMLAPYFSSQFADHIVEGRPLDPEVDISRLTSKG